MCVYVYIYVYVYMGFPKIRGTFLGKLIYIYIYIYVYIYMYTHVTVPLKRHTVYDTTN